MQASNQGADPFHPAQHKAGPKTDQDFAAFGAAFNQVKVPVYVAVLVLTQAAQPILIQVRGFTGHRFTKEQPDSSGKGYHGWQVLVRGIMGGRLWWGVTGGKSGEGCLRAHVYKRGITRGITRGLQPRILADQAHERAISVRTWNWPALVWGVPAQAGKAVAL
eukprot:776533-Pelagomonas_calceolata.AAC.1